MCCSVIEHGMRSLSFQPTVQKDDAKLSSFEQFEKEMTSYCLWGVCESMDGRGCAILALEVVPKNLIFT